MKQIITSLHETTLSRIRNPIIGTFIFSWLLLNIKGVSYFLLSSRAQKLDIIHNWTPALDSDFGVPALITVCYLVLLPLLQLAYQYFDDVMLQPVKHDFKHQSLINYYKSLKAVNEKKADSDEERIAKMKDEKILDWIDEKKRISSIVLSNREEHSKRISELDQIESKVLPTLELHTRKDNKLNEYIKRLKLVQNTLNNAPTPPPKALLERIDFIKYVIADLEAIATNSDDTATNLIQAYQGNFVFLIDEPEMHIHSANAELLEKLIADNPAT
ncbi:hypothetical protein A130_14000 [Vibrio genomosp. F6 str. FF-238]|uniref:Uncharacterized protein n=2 Tax=Vibrio genomosp. F6 TaxID=723172 RepID=A0A1E5D2U3_9VIBR|nr:hypothetical protein A130_14000 [Vibrio genomosp. F6 str. FF-238]